LHALEDEPDIGDLYTFCSGGAVSGPELVGSRLVRDDEVLQELLITVSFPGIHVETSVSVAHGSERVEVRTIVNNESRDHRLRVRFPVESDERIVRAESQFAVVRRPVETHRPHIAWAEPPSATAHTLGAVALGPLALVTRGLPEYEADAGGLRLTLIRSVGVIARPPGLASRPLGAGPNTSTPDGQCLGTHELEYSLRFDAARLSDAALIRAGQDYREDFAVGEAFAAPFAIEGDVVFSSLKGAEDGDGCVVRLFNPNSTGEQVRISGVATERIRLDEEAPVDRPSVLGPGEIATYRVTR
jgi:alpha-mannosidase